MHLIKTTNHYHGENSCDDISPNAYENAQIDEIYNIINPYKKVINEANKYFIESTKSLKKYATNFSVENSITTLIENNKIFRIVEVINAVVAKAGITLETFFKNISSVPATVNTLPSHLAVMQQDTILLKNLRNQFIELNASKECFAILTKGISAELDNLLNSVSFASFEKPLKDYFEAYTKFSMNINAANALYNELLKQKNARLGNVSHIPDNLSLHVFSLCYGKDLKQIHSELKKFQCRTDEIAKAYVELENAKIAMNESIEAFRKKFSFLAFLCAESKRPGDPWGYTSSYTEETFDYANNCYIDHPLIFSETGMLKKLKDRGNDL